MSKEIREQIDRVKNWEQFLNESTDRFTSRDVTRSIFDSLSDEQIEDWSFEDYHKVIKKYGKYWKLEKVNPKSLKFNEDFDDDTVEDYLYSLENGKELSPITVDDKNEIIDGNHRAKASLIYGKDILAYLPIPNK